MRILQGCLWIFEGLVIWALFMFIYVPTTFSGNDDVYGASEFGNIFVWGNLKMV